VLPVNAVPGTVKDPDTPGFVLFPTVLWKTRSDEANAPFWFQSTYIWTRLAKFSAPQLFWITVKGTGSVWATDGPAMDPVKLLYRPAMDPGPLAGVEQVFWLLVMVPTATLEISVSAALVGPVVV
jgi:hypothetical protein